MSREERESSKGEETLYIYTKAERSILVAVIPITIPLDTPISDNTPPRYERYLDY